MLSITEMIHTRFEKDIDDTIVSNGVKAQSVDIELNDLDVSLMKLLK